MIQASEENTITSLNALAPTLTEFAKSGDDFVNSLQIFLTYPFIDGIVGKNAQQARDLHMGDYTNLSVKLDLDLEQILEDGIGIPGGPTVEIPDCEDIPNPEIGQLCRDATGEIIRITQEILDQLPSTPVPTVTVPPAAPVAAVATVAASSRTCQGSAGPAVGAHRPTTAGRRSRSGVDTDLAAMLLWGVMAR